MKKEHDTESAESGEELTARQQRLLVELVKNPDLQSAARAAGVGRTTAYRWLDQPAFAGELSQRRNEAMKEALSSIKAHTARAATELTRLLDTDDERLRWRICSEILRNAIKVRELEEIEQRLMLVEQKLNSSPKRSLT